MTWNPVAQLLETAFASVWHSTMPIKAQHTLNRAVQNGSHWTILWPADVTWDHLAALLLRRAPKKKQWSSGKYWGSCSSDYLTIRELVISVQSGVEICVQRTQWVVLHPRHMPCPNPQMLPVKTNHRKRPAWLQLELPTLLKGRSFFFFFWASGISVKVNF